MAVLSRVGNHGPMSVPVPLDRLRAEIGERGAACFLVTIGERGPHVVSVQVGWDGDALTAGVGGRTAANVATTPAVTLLWPAPAFEELSLLVDGAATAAAGTLTILPSAAVLHRSAAGAGSGPTCVKVLPEASA